MRATVAGADQAVQDAMKTETTIGYELDRAWQRYVEARPRFEANLGALRGPLLCAARTYARLCANLRPRRTTRP